MSRPLPNFDGMHTRLEIAKARDRIFESMTDEPSDVDGRLALYAQHDRLVNELRGGLGL